MHYRASNGRTYHACTCMCHDVGCSVMHFMPCCDLCYEKYIEKGKVNPDKVAAIVEVQIEKEKAKPERTD